MELPDVLEVFIADMAAYIGPMRDARDVSMEFAAAVGDAHNALQMLDIELAAKVIALDQMAAAANDAAAAVNDIGGAAATTTATGMRLFGMWIPGWLTLGGILSAVHLGLVVFAAQVVADAVGIGVFALAATKAFGPVVSAIDHMTTAYSGLNNYQKAAALSLQSFINGLQSADQAGLFGVFYQGLTLVRSALAATGGVLPQATKAFSDFAGMLQADFASPQWAAVFGHSASVVRTDLDALFRLINSGINLIPALFHNFNSLGLAVINAASDFLNGARAVMEWNSTLTKVVALGTAAWAFWKLFGGWILGTLIPALRGAAIAMTAFVMNLAAGEGLAGSIALMTGLSAATVATGLALGALGLAFGGLLLLAGHTTNAIHEQITAWKINDNAIGNNAAGYRELAAQIGQNTSKLQLSVQANRDYGTSLQQTGIQLSSLRQQFLQTANNIDTNAHNLGQALGLTSKQVVAFANATGVDLTHALNVNGAAFAADVSKIGGYAQAVTLSHNPLKQFQVDVNQSRSAANTLTQQVQALQAAFAALITPTLNVIQGAVQLKQAEQTLRQDLIASNGAIGNQNKASQTSALAFVAAANAALTQSAAVKQQTGSTKQAAGPLQTLINLADNLHIHGRLAAAALRELKAAEDALYNKTITITVNQVGAVLGGQFGRPQPGQVAPTSSTTQPPGQVIVHNHISGVLTDQALLELSHATVRAVGGHTLRNGSNQLFQPTRGH